MSGGVGNGVRRNAGKLDSYPFSDSNGNGNTISRVSISNSERPKCKAPVIARLDVIWLTLPAIHYELFNFRLAIWQLDHLAV